jgi:hypothetical protein
VVQNAELIPQITRVDRDHNDRPRTEIVLHQVEVFRQ